MTEINFKTLTVEIKAFEKYLEPTQYETSCRDSIVSKIQQHVSRRLSTAVARTFGSYETKLLLPNSDVDIAVSCPNNPGKSARSIMKQIRPGLVNLGIHVEFVVTKATVPLLKCIDLSSQLGFDITFQADVSSSNRTLQWIKEHSELKPLFLIIKHSLLGIRLEVDPAYRALDSSRGGVASYALICLIVHYLKYNELAKSFEDPATRLGHLLYSFLQFYATFDFEKTGLTFKDTNGFFDLATSARFKVPALTREHRIIIQNPDEPDQNVARACMTAKKFQAVLSWMHDTLKPLIKHDEPSPFILKHIVAVEVFDSGVPRKNLVEYMFPVISLSNDVLRAHVQLDMLMMKKRTKRAQLRNSSKRVRKTEDDQERGQDHSRNSTHEGQSSARKRQRTG